MKIVATNRKVVFATGETYHIFNRGVEKRQVFSDKRDYNRAVDILSYYRFSNPPIRFSHFNRLKRQQKELLLSELQKHIKEVSIYAYCLMPNHFHFLIRQAKEKGVATFIANVTNSYTKYFNTKYERVGPLYQGTFKAVHIDTDELFLHVSRYIHLNPTTAFLIKPEEILRYEWSSLNEYVSDSYASICDKEEVLSHFQNSQKYLEFVKDQADYARTLSSIRHAVIEE